MPIDICYPLLEGIDEVSKLHGTRETRGSRDFSILRILRISIIYADIDSAAPAAHRDVLAWLRRDRALHARRDVMIIPHLFLIGMRFDRAKHFSTGGYCVCCVMKMPHDLSVIDYCRAYLHYRWVWRPPRRRYRLRFQQASSLTAIYHGAMHTALSEAIICRFSFGRSLGWWERRDIRYATLGHGPSTI